MASTGGDAPNPTPPVPSEERLNESTDYSKYGITDAPKPTKTTALGRTKTVAGLRGREWLFLAISVVNIVTAGALTLVRLVQVVQDEPKSVDLSFTILLLVNAAFCMFYVVHGVLRERVYELYALMVAIFIVLMYCILEYAFFNPSHRTDIKLARLIVACIMAPPNIVIAWLVSREFGFLEFRIVGASQFLQSLYRQAAIFSCLLKFDLQATMSLVVLALEDGTSVSLLEWVSVGVGVPFSILWCLLGWVMLRREWRHGAIAFAVIGLAKPGYYVYKVVEVYTEILQDTEPSTTLTYSLLAAVTIALFVWIILMYELLMVMMTMTLLTFQ
ncbi:uncharacterized protein LOC143285224 isoform X2 [Babylonia areolata]|uniref:uncharacterized protein LOC143285224 isoform X2 n=1 Tax=Babylonia areolata TaxID=304850 RepID=UPI003FCFF71C